MKASRFFGIYAPAIYVLERHKLGAHYALIGGYGCKYWYRYYSDRYITNLKSLDIDIKGERNPVAITLRDYWPATISTPQVHDDNPNSVTYVLKHELRRGQAKAEVIKLVPTLEKDTPIAQGIAYRIPCKYDKDLTVSVLDPCSLFVSKLPAYQNMARRRRVDKHDGEHLELLAAIMPFYFRDAYTLEQAQKPDRDPRVAANLLLKYLTEAQKNGKLMELPPSIDRNALIQNVREFVGPVTAVKYDAEFGI
jgi:hypothetical protein